MFYIYETVEGAGMPDSAVSYIRRKTFKLMPIVKYKLNLINQWT